MMMKLHHHALVFFAAFCLVLLSCGRSGLGVVSAQQQQLDCTLGDFVELNDAGSLRIRQIINQVEQTVTVELVYDGTAWIGFAISETGQMFVTRAVIGLPDAGTGGGDVMKYDMTDARAVNLAEDSGTLTDASVTQIDGVTTLRFTKPLVEEGEQAVVVGSNRFIWAYGSGNALGYHGQFQKGDEVLDFGECLLPAGVTAAPVPAPVPVPPTAPPPPTAAPTAAAPLGGNTVVLPDGRLQSTLELENGDLEVILTADEDAGTIQVDMSYPAEAWIAFGFSEDALMPGSVAVIALPDSGEDPQKYDLNQRSLDGVVPSSRQTLLNSTMSQEDGVTTLSFTKLMVEEDEPAASLTENTNFLYAIGFDNTLATHRIGKGFNLQGGEFGSPNEDLWRAHGICMAVAWAILVPLAVGSSVIRDLLCFLPDGMWFQIHRALNVTGVLLTCAGFGIAVHLFNQEEREHFSQETHHKVGLVVFIFAVLQGISGVFRPHLPHSNKPDPDAPEEHEEDGGGDAEGGDGGGGGAETTTATTDDDAAPAEKSKCRLVWEYQHRILGVTTMALAWFNCDSGLELFNLRFQGKDLQGALWGVIAGIAGLTLVLAIYSRFVKKRQ